MNVTIGNRYTLPKGQSFWSIALQENVVSTRDIIIKVDSVAYGQDYVFGKIQVKFENYPLKFLIGDAATTYMDKAHGDVSVHVKQLNRE